MGRHSASYIAAQGHSTGSTTSSAAKYVGGVGAMALSLWAGAAIAGGGLANADETAPSAPDPAGQVKSALHSLTGGLSHALGGGSEADGTSGVKLPKPPGLFTLPKSTSDGGNAFTGPLAGLAGRGSHQTSTALSETTAKPSSQRGIQPVAGPISQAVPVVSAVTGALRGGASSPGGTAFGTPDLGVATTTAATLTAFASTSAATQSFSPTSAATQSFSPSIASVPTGFLTALNPLTNNGGGSPAAPAAAVLPGALQLLRRETTQTSLAQPLSLASIGSLLNPTPTPTLPSNYPAPTDATTVALPGGNASIGKYMVQSNGQVSNYGGQPYQNKTMVEPVNVIIVDPNSTSAAQSQAKVTKDMTLAGFPPQPVHSSGFSGYINGVNYGQKPALPLTAYSDNSFLVQNDHGRLFGPAPAPGGGYVYSGSFSTETPTIYNGLPAHAYVSSNAARDALLLRLIASGQVQSFYYVPMDNAIPSSDPNLTTGNHDGQAVVIVLK